MDRHVVFDFFSDSKETAITKLSGYLHIPQSKIEQALKYDCTPESFINELRIDLSAHDSSAVSVVGRHVTTSAEDELLSFHKNGLLDLRTSLQGDTPLSRFLKSHKIQIDVDRKRFDYGRRSVPIEGRKNPNHICFMGREAPCSWLFGCDAFQKLGVLNAKLYELGATLEFFVAGTIEEMLGYTTVSRCPEILDTIDQFVAKMNSPYGQCMYPLCYDWMAQYPNCYVVEFKCLLSDMDTYAPINYLDAYSEIKGCFNWRHITYDDYYEHRIPQRVFDNRYLISRVIDVYIYSGSEQYGSLQPGLSIHPEALKVYRVVEDKLVPL